MHRPRLSIPRPWAALAVPLGLLLATMAGTEPIRIMVAGDSLAVGMGSEASLGYRKAFYDKVTAAGFEVEFVGGQTSGEVEAVAAHEGHAGIEVEEVSSDIQGWLRKFKPDVVLLMVGTNDAADDPLVIESWEIHFSVAVDRVLSRRDTKLFVSTIPPGKYGRNQAKREIINQTIRDYVTRRQKRDADLVLIDIWDKIDDQFDMYDYEHLNESGYEKVAGEFAKAFIANMKPPTGSDPESSSK